LVDDPNTATEIVFDEKDFLTQLGTLVSEHGEAKCARTDLGDRPVLPADQLAWLRQKRVRLQNGLPRLRSLGKSRIRTRLQGVSQGE